MSSIADGLLLTVEGTGYPFVLLDLILLLNVEVTVLLIVFILLLNLQLDFTDLVGYSFDFSLRVVILHFLLTNDGLHLLRIKGQLLHRLGSVER